MRWKRGVFTFVPSVSSVFKSGHLTLRRKFTYSAFNRDASDSIYELLYLPLLVLYE